MSKSRKVTYLGASRSQPKVFEAGWVVLPAKSKSDPPKYHNVFTGDTVSDRNEIPEFADPASGGGGPNSTPQRNGPDAENGDDNSNNNTNKRKRPEDDDDGGDEQKKAAEHYNKLQRKQEDRGKGALAKMRALNNWVKVVLLDDNIQKSMQSSSAACGSGTVSILELACGKGGDFFKIQKAMPSGTQSISPRYRWKNLSVECRTKETMIT